MTPKLTRKAKTPKIAEVVKKVVALLERLELEDRQKAISASLTIPGAPQVAAGAPGSSGGSGELQSAGGSGRRADQDAHGIPARATAWMKQNNLTMADIEQVFHLNGDQVDVIAAEAPGESDKARTLNAYVLQGLSRLLVTGEPSFDDKAARELCRRLGCFNKTNHSHYLADKGNEITGSRVKGWSVTGPGLRAGAALIKEMAKAGA